MKKKIGITAGLLVIAVGYLAFRLFIGAEQPVLISSLPDNKLENDARPVATAIVQPFNHKKEHQFPGKVRATNRADLAFMVAGVVAELDILEGQAVKKGQLLAALDPRDYRYEHDAAAARYVAAERNFKRAQNLWQQKILSQSDYDAATSEYEIAKAELEIKKKSLQDTRLLAPFDGLVASRYVEEEEQVKRGESIVSLQDISRIEVVIQLAERLVANGGANELRQVRVCFDTASQHCYDAVIHEFAVESNPVTRTYAVVVALETPPDLNILPGMTATVLWAMRDSINASDNDKETTLIPIEAVLYSSDGQPYAWVIDPVLQNAHRQDITVGSMQGDDIAVITGLKAGEHVAIAGLHSLHEKMKARPMRADKEGLEG